MTNEEAARKIENLLHHCDVVIGTLYSTEENALQMAVKALRNQRKSAIPDLGFSGDGYSWYVCGICKARINPTDKYCRDCGAKALWPGVGEE